MKVSFVTTVYNEESTIKNLVESLFSQSRIPDEIIIVDGGSIDATASIISNLKSQISNKQIKFKVFVKKGNRSVGRNEAIKNASNDIIVCSDAGCILDKDWVKNITKPFEDPNVDVVAGYYKGKPRTIFEKCLIPYVLVMENRVNPNDFLPATRSMAFRKSIWKKVGGFLEEFSHNEDYVFGHKLKEIKAKIVFEKRAISYWVPRRSFKESFIMFFRFALGDAEARIFRTKVILLLCRYAFAFYLLVLAFLLKSIALNIVIGVVFLSYLIWSIWKNYRYVNRWEGIIILPLLQIMSDIAVIIGTVVGVFKKIDTGRIEAILFNNKAAAIIVIAYAVILLGTIKWGIPNENHPFPYHMDEWHQLQAVRATLQHGTPNVEGAAHGTMLHFFLSGAYLTPFVALNVVDPFAIKSAVSSLSMQERLFEILRINTLIFGILSMIIIAKIVKSYFGVSTFTTVFLFTVTPIWFILSGYFKYDIALIFWINLFMLFVLRFGKNPTSSNFLLISLPGAFALATKISSLPIVISYILSFFLFMPKWKENFKYLLLGVLSFILLFIFTGIPDLVFGKGNLFGYIYNNVIQTPQQTDNLQLNVSYWLFAFFRQFPVAFGHAFFFFSVLATAYWAFLFMKAFTTKTLKYLKPELFIFISLFIFALSLVPLGVYSGGNRSLVLLPFLTIISSVTIGKLFKKWRFFSILLIALFFIIQAIESYSWIHMKLGQSPQEKSSIWLLNNITWNTNIGIENIPIYQSLPDLIIKDFYEKQYNPQSNSIYKYSIINSETKTFPEVVVLTNAKAVSSYEKKSDKKEITKRLNKEGYKEVVSFSPDFNFFRFFGNEMDYYFNPLVASPGDIAVFIRQK